MRTVVASILIVVSLAVFGFVAMKWMPVVWENGLSEAFDELKSSRANMVAAVVLLVFGSISFGLGVLVGPEKRV